MLVQLKSKSLHGKNRLYEAGTNIWNIIRTGKTPSGSLGMLIVPKDHARPNFYLRWLLNENDPDYIWEQKL